MTRRENKKSIIEKTLEDFEINEIDDDEGRSESYFQKIPNWLWGIFLFLAIIIILEIGYLFFLFYQKDQLEDRVVWHKEQRQDEENVDDFEGYPRKIDGVLMEKEADTDLPLVGVMIDNMINARPPCGLSQASLVIESITESDITRFLAVFDLSVEVDKIGPVRSARPYFAEWAEELSAVYAHSGGSPESLSNLAGGVYGVYDLNEFYRGTYFWRDNNRYAPHNLFTSSDFLSEYINSSSSINKEPEYEAWQFADQAELESRGEDEQKIEIYFNDYDHYVYWIYDKEANEYLRYQMNAPHCEADGTQIRAKNIAVQYVSMEVLDYVGRKRIPTIGSKSSIIFKDGQAIEGYWNKEAKGLRTKFYNADDSEIEFNRGTTWIEVVPVGTRVEY